MNRHGSLALQHIRNSRFTAALAFFLTFFGCVISAHGQSAAPATVSGSDIVAMLDRAKSEKIELSRAEKNQLKAKGFIYYNTDVKSCNTNDYYNDRLNYDVSDACRRLAYLLNRYLGVTSHATELAYQRECAFRHHKDAEPCHALWSFYEERGDYTTAMAVFLYAPNCAQEGDSCINGAIALSNKMANKQIQATVLKLSCEKFSNPDSCMRLNREFGGSEDVAAARSRRQQTNTNEKSAFDNRLASELIQGTPTNGDSAWAALGKLDDDDDPPQREPKQSAVDTAINVLQSMPGASDPNAILHAANQQSAQMLAIGAANDAARRQAAQDRLAAQQAAAQARPQRQNATAAISTQQNQQLTSANSNSGSENGLGASGNSTASPQPAIVPQLPPNCLRVSVKLFYDSQPDSGMYYGVNNCGVQITVDIAMASGYAGATRLLPGAGDFLGASANMGSYKVWYCAYPYWPSDPHNHPENGPLYSADLNAVVCQDPAHPGQLYGNAAGLTK
ncbi:MAG TPA: hypothetical protein VKP58_11660 [Candidatus Acidoferrum sp.]|nr:hypothetical protein [Candidatus Acidoferrum sp.]